MKNKILQHINILRYKPYMIVNKIEGYHTYESYFNGFFGSIDLMNDLSISRGFSCWVGTYYGIENTNVDWTGFLRVQFKGKTEQEMIELFFDLLNNYIEQLDSKEVMSQIS